MIPNALGSLHFDRSTLRHLCATPEGSSLTMAVSPRAKVGRSWAGLQFVGASTFGVDSVASLLDAHERGDLEGAVLFDSPCASACPGALRMSNTSAATGPLPAPRYFPVDYSAALEGPRGVGVRTKTDPDLFVSRAGTSTHAHVDSGCTRFYMLQLYGRKLWRVFAPDEDANLHRAANGHFEADVLRPDAARWPGLARVRRAHEFVLHPGELVLIPESWSHAVYNLDDTSALTLNFVDDANLACYLDSVAPAAARRLGDFVRVAARQPARRAAAAAAAARDKHLLYHVHLSRRLARRRPNATTAVARDHLPWDDWFSTQGPYAAGGAPAIEREIAALRAQLLSLPPLGRPRRRRTEDACGGGGGGRRAAPTLAVACTRRAAPRRASRAPTCAPRRRASAATPLESWGRSRRDRPRAVACRGRRLRCDLLVTACVRRRRRRAAGGGARAAAGGGGGGAL